MVRVGPFELEEPIGRGGMAVVWRGRHHRQQVPVAVKVITGRLARDRRFNQAFRHEIRAAARLEHPHIARVLDEGRIPPGLEEHDLIAGSPYLAMELIEGVKLRDVANGAINFTAVKNLLMGILDALAHAHARDIIHRDLKPGNVLVSRDEFGQLSPHLVDFGIAHAIAPAPSIEQGIMGEFTRGTPRYMAPEQVRDEIRDQGPWTDLYAVGCIAFVLATGHPPYREATHQDTMLAHLEHPIPPLTCGFQAPDGFERWVHTMIAKVPSQRFRSAADAAWALSQLQNDGLAEEESSSIVPGTIDAIPTVVVTTESFDSDEWTQRSKELAAITSASMQNSSAPPMPANWRRKRRKKFDHLLGAGLGLYALRPVPMVGRESERDRLWQTLQNVHHGSGSGALIVRGPSGVGKTRLLQWMCERVQEVGAATVWKVTHNRQPGPLDGIRGGLTRAFRVGGMSRSKASARILNWFNVHGELDDLSMYDSVALAEMVAEDGEDTEMRVRFTNDRERWVVLARWLERLSESRPVVVWIDDAQWGRESLDFMRFILEDETRPVLFMLSVREDALAELPEREAEVETLLGRDDVEELHLGPLDEEVHQELVQQLIGLDKGLAKAVTRRTIGNPLFAVQLVGDWVERGLLQATEKGFALADEMPELPDDLHEVWRRRLELVASKTDSFAAPIALEVAACLGLSFELRELRAALDALDVNLPGRLLDELADARLAELKAEREVVSFVHPMLVESLERQSREQGRFQAAHNACARGLRAVHGTADMRVVGAIGRHFVEADELEEALEPLLFGARRAVEGRDMETARSLAESRERALDRLRFGYDTRETLESRLIRAWIADGEGQLGAASAEAEAVSRLARKEGWLDLVGQALCIRGKIARRTSPEESEAFMTVAVEALEEAGTEIGELAKAQLASGWNLARLRHYEEGLDRMREALANFERVGDPFWTVTAHNAIGFHLSQLERWDEAEASFEAALEAAHASGSRSRLALTYCHLGEFARHNRRWSEARKHYKQAEELERSIGGPNAPIYFYDQALVDMGEEKWMSALATLETLHADRGQLANLNIALDAGIAYLACLAAVGDWETFDEHYVRVYRMVKLGGPLDRDMEANATLAVQFCDEQGEVGRAERMHTLIDYEHISAVLEP